MARLNERLSKLELASGGDKGIPNALVVYDGPHDPNAVVNAIGLQHLKTLVVQVIAAEGATNEPRLVGNPFYLPDCPWVLTDEQDALQRRPSGDNRRRWTIFWGFRGKSGGSVMDDSPDWYWHFKRTAAQETATK